MGTSRRGGIRIASENRADNRHCARAVMEAFPLLFRHIRNELMKGNRQAFSISQMRVLTLLNDSPGVSLSEAADFIGVTPATASVIIERLVKRGMVSRVEDPQERRKVLLALTLDGKRQLQQMREKMLSMVADVLAALPSHELSQIKSGASILSKTLQGIHHDS